ncbi:tail fiber domain-containing protein [Polyangium jinanense]|uniref:Peptidase S74 domain-containing protein n=1 Tax=Polyangium jinanense TaxID=2829994 RepID=A0A9X3XHX0_9BACT|nr:hypothetical protein [Polyangium jinanense]MDC3962633.1 hypothetical protein [Polyangium jinanense]MDC3988351.1 hypothetical protein [Polyangium jinanense]
MNAIRLGMVAMLAGLFVTAASGCKSKIDGGGGGEGGQAGGAGGQGGTGGQGGGGSLQWYTTCGDPVCEIPDGGAMPPQGVAVCTTEKEGEPCSQSGATCWPEDSTCGVLLTCAASDPKDNPGGCPISRVSHKKDISYLSERAVEALADEAMAMRLSTWRYKGEDAAARPHVGFLIDDMPESAAVAASGERVDLYGYTSMAIAATQVHDKRIDALERELATLREEMGALRAKASHCESAEASSR